MILSGKMKKIGIISLTRQNSLAISTLKRIATKLGYQPICGEAIGADSIYMSLEDLTLKGYDFLGNFFQKTGFPDSDVILISAPYSANLFILPKVIWCLRNVSSAPIILGGNEASNNYKNLMLYRFFIFVNQTVDIAPDFIVRGPAENVLFSLLPILDQGTMDTPWSRDFIRKLLEIPSAKLVDWDLSSEIVLEHARLVVIIRGAIGLEAVIKKKPVVSLGKSLFELLPPYMFRTCWNLYELPYAIRDMLDNYQYDHDALVQYLASVMKGSAPVNLVSDLLEKKGRFRTEIGDKDLLSELYQHYPYGYQKDVCQPWYSR